MKVFDIISLIVVAYYSRPGFAVELDLDFVSSCNSTTTFEYLIFKNGTKGLSNCSVHYGIQESVPLQPLAHHVLYDFLDKSGIITVSNLLEGHFYALQVICGNITSKVIPFKSGGDDCPEDDITQSPVVVFKEQSSFLGTRDSVLGIVFALFGVLIIVVTTFYIALRIKRRRRLQRIRRYIGSSLIIDPFENLQNREEENVISERLIETTETES